MTFARACEHITNYTCGHESRVTKLGGSRFDYPEDHIEIDNRLAWFLGDLEERFGPTPYYVHLVRDKNAVAKSYEQRMHRSPRTLVDLWYPRTSVRRVLRALRGEDKRSMSAGFLHSVLCMTGGEPSLRLRACEFLADTINKNIAQFLRDKPRVMTVHIERATTEYLQFWQWIKAEGDLGAALSELTVRHNSS